MRAFKNFVKTSKGRLLLCMLSIGIISSTAPVEQARAIDAQAVGSSVMSLGMLMMVNAATDSFTSMAKCPGCFSTGTGCSDAASKGCLFLALNIAAIAGALIPIFTGGKEKGAVTGGGMNGFGENGNFDPNTPLAQVIGCPPGEAACDCGGTNASSNPLCGPDALKNAKDQLSKISAGLKDGSLQPPDGQSVESLLASNEAAAGNIDSLLKGKIPDAGDSAGIGDNVAGISNGSGGQGGSGSGGEILAGGSDGGGGSGANGRNAGPVDRAGLGRVTMINGLDVIDDATGKSLTIWQRLTRRHQGDEKGSRAFLMAKIEVMRKHALGAQTMSKTASAKPAEADRAPSSVKPATPAKLEQKH